MIKSQNEKCQEFTIISLCIGPSVSNQPRCHGLHQNRCSKLSHLGPACLLTKEILNSGRKMLYISLQMSEFPADKEPLLVHFSARTSIDEVSKDLGKSGALFTVPF